MTKEKSAPKYLTLKRELIDYIDREKLRADDKFLSVNDIERQFNCSSITVRHALRELQKDGVIYTVNKKGSFVAPTHQKSKTFYLVYGPSGISPEINEHIQLGIRKFIESGQNIRVVPVHMDTIREQAKQLFQLNPDLAGILFYRMYDVLLELQPTLKQAGVPFVFFGSASVIDAARKDIPSIVYDESRVLHLALEHLKSKGFRSIAFLGDQDLISHHRCLQYVEQMLIHKMNSPQMFVIQGEKSFVQVREALQNVTKSIEAIICVSDRVAVKAVQVLKEMGFKVPQELAVLSIDGSFLCEYVDPCLSSIDLGVEDSIYRCLDYLNLEQVAIPATWQQFSEISLLERESTSL
jgi:DNA-binding LacI/PurR family transcriptional regulator